MANNSTRPVVGSSDQTPGIGSNGMPRNGAPAGPWAKFYSNEPVTQIDTGPLHRGPGYTDADSDND